MPTRKIKDIDPCELRGCTHPEHQPPSMMVYPPGEYEHECPGCGQITRFNVYPTHFLRVDKEPSIEWTTPRVGPLAQIRALDVPRGLSADDVATDC